MILILVAFKRLARIMRKPAILMNMEIIAMVWLRSTAKYF